MLSPIEEILAKIQRMPEAERAALEEQVLEGTKDEIWMPNPGPQSDAYFSPADLLLYGGQGGGGKTDLITGLGLTQHQRTLIMRPQYVDLGAIIDRSIAIAGGRAGLNASPPAQFKYDGRIIDYGGANTLEKAESFQGNPHDLLAFDEACQFIEAVVKFLLGWNRAAEEELGAVSTQRVRAVLASNPPLNAAGEWIIGSFRPWLDITHPLYGKIKHGELVYYITDPDGKDLEVSGPDDIKEFTDGKGVTKQYIPKSRTFIPAALADNPFLVNTDYQATLDAMPEPIRSAIRDGNFMAAREDDAFQVIPSLWVLKANERWREREKPDVAMSSLGLDVARGGRDDTVFTPRWGTYFGEQTVVPGRKTPDGPSVAVLAAGMLREGAVVGVDNIGVGADAETALKNANLPYECMNGAEAATAHTRDGAFGFATRRSEMWWMLREALDPDYGFDIALPPDQGLMADLTTPTYEVRPGQPPKIYVESTKDMMKRLGRSPDKGSSVVYAWNSGGMDLHGSPQRGKLLHSPAPETDYDERRR